MPHITVQRNFGTDRAYPADDTARLFRVLTGRVTFTASDLRAIKALGFEVRVVAMCVRCGLQFTPRNGGAHCHACLVDLGRQAAKLRGDGLLWREIADRLGYRNLGNLCTYAKRYGEYAPER